MPDENEFYISLMSSSSIKFYPSNTLSAFTNLLSQKQKLSEEWCVGLSEIGLVPFTEAAADNEDVASALASETPVLRNVRDVDVEEEEEDSDRKIVIKLNETHSIVLTQQILAKYSDSNNVIELIEEIDNILTDNIQPPLDSPLSLNFVRGTIKKNIFEIMDGVKFKSWGQQEHRLYEIEPDEYQFFFYTDKAHLQSCVLKYREYNNIHAFVQDIVLQIPIQHRHHYQLYNLFDKFYPEYKINHYEIAAKKNDNNQTVGSFVNTDVNAYSSLQEVIKSSVERETQVVTSAVKEGVLNLSNHTTATAEKTVSDVKASVKKAVQDGMRPMLHAISARSVSAPVAGHTSAAPTATSSTFIYVYCDIMKPRLVGGERARCLRVMPASSQMNKEFKNIEYYPLEKTFFDSISIMITDQYGTQINFVPNVIPVYVMLHFKRKNV